MSGQRVAGVGAVRLYHEQEGLEWIFHVLRKWRALVLQVSLEMLLQSLRAPQIPQLNLHTHRCRCSQSVSGLEFVALEVFFCLL